MGLSRFMLLVTFSCIVGAFAESTYNVIDYGAVGDGQTKDTEAFLATWNATCLDATGNATFLVPSGTFLLDQIEFTGLCKSYVHVKVDGEIVRPNDHFGEETYWIMFRQISGLRIDGIGQIHGRGNLYWNCKLKHECKLAPNTLVLLHVDNLELSELKFIDSPQMHVVIGFSSNVRVHHLTITAPEDSPNTDGIHVEQCEGVEISNSIIATGDDCISLGNGTISADVKEISCGPGHGISIGSLGAQNTEAEVEKLHISDSVIFNTTNGMRIKSWQGGSGYARDITFRNIKLKNVQNPIIIDQFYCPWQVCSIQPSAVSISNVSFIDISGTSASDVSINLNCSQSVGCRDIVMQNVCIEAEEQIEQLAATVSHCSNAHGRKEGLVMPDVPCLHPGNTGAHASFPLFY